MLVNKKFTHIIIYVLIYTYKLWHCATYLIFFTWLEVFKHHELLWNQSNPIIPFIGRVCHRCSKRTQKTWRNPQQLYSWTWSQQDGGHRRWNPLLDLWKHSKDWAIEIHNIEILSYQHWITERSYNIEPKLNYKSDYRTRNYLNELLNTNTINDYIIESRYTTTKVKIIHFQCYITDILLWEFKFCLILDAIEAWLLLKLPLKIWTIRSNQCNTHFAKWLARYRGGFKYTKFIDQFCPI